MFVLVAGDARLEVYAACLFYRQYRLFELQMLCRYGYVELLIFVFAVASG